jgi:LmbE family N-acetylglucosaminyl deacetylase
MKRAKKIFITVALALLFFILGHIYYLTTLSAKETYPEDTFLESVKNKTALIIVAHDDDMISNCGTITKLCKSGWKIKEMCFYQQGGLYAIKNVIRTPIRKRDLQRVSEIQGLSGVDPIDFNFRNDTNTEKPYMPMPYAKFKENFKIDSLKKIIASYIQKYKPSVIFTLDNVIGGYGNPEHVLMSQLVVEHCLTQKADTTFSVKRIYQAVFPPSLAESVMREMPVYVSAKEIYQCNGMPLPNVQVDVSDYSALKKECLLAYTTEQNSLKQIWPFYNWYPSWIYFKIFDRDFFRIINLEK